MNSRYRPPQSLAAHHVLDRFECASSEQGEWLRRFARQSTSTGTTKVFVVTGHDSEEVVAYHAWRMAQVRSSDAPHRLRQGGGRTPQPVALLARLAVHVDHEGRGLGAGLLQDVFARLSALSGDIGWPGLLVHAESARARAFYLHMVPELETSPTDDLHLVLPMKDVRRTLGS
ncbi:MAG: GNAT family N-acetyltransferase [Actinomycetota bacterium]|nr:GNAT family N-acetyltransferase [Actinomycetota bacterium]